MHASPRQTTEPFGYLCVRYNAQRRLKHGLLDVAAVVDVVLLILLFFVINASFVLQPGVAVDLPVAPFENGASYDALIVTMTQEGMVFFNDERTTLEGLALAFAQAAHEDPESRLIIEADARVSHGTVVDVYNMASGAGISSVVLASRLPVTAVEEEP